MAGDETRRVTSSVVQYAARQWVVLIRSNIILRRDDEE